jgi:hypothetical protein
MNMCSVLVFLGLAEVQSSCAQDWHQVNSSSVVVAMQAHIDAEAGTDIDEFSYGCRDGEGGPSGGLPNPCTTFINLKTPYCCGENFIECWDPTIDNCRGWQSKQVKGWLLQIAAAAKTFSVTGRFQYIDGTIITYEIEHINLIVSQMTVHGVTVVFVPDSCANNTVWRTEQMKVVKAKCTGWNSEFPRHQPLDCGRYTWSTPYPEDLANSSMYV